MKNRWGIWKTDMIFKYCINSSFLFGVSGINCISIDISAWCVFVAPHNECCLFFKQQYIYFIYRIIPVLSCWNGIDWKVNCLFNVQYYACFGITYTKIGILWILFNCYPSTDDFSVCIEGDFCPYLRKCIACKYMLMQIAQKETSLKVKTSKGTQRPFTKLPNWNA